jgi:Ca2+-binding EF-hand superfamily protein
MKSAIARFGTAAVTAFLAAAAPVSAQPSKPDGDELAKLFAAADKDSNGRLTLEEAKAGMPRIAANFDKIDKDKKGYVTIEQIKAIAPKR